VVAVPSPAEVHTVTDDGAVAFVGTRVLRYEGLAPATDYDFDGVAFRTLPRPGGERLATIATVNDVHFGETECGRLEGHDVGPVLTSAAGSEPYPEVMNRAVAAEIAALGADLVVAKGDLTAHGLAAEYGAFEAVYRPPLGDRLVVTRGNHDHPASGPCFSVPMVECRRLDGVTVAVVDTSRRGEGGGGLEAEQLDRLDGLAAGSDQPVLVFGHHPMRDADVEDWMGEASGLDGLSTTGLLDLVERRREIRGYFAGHTHRNRVKRFLPGRDVAFGEVACTKDFPGSWAEYRVYEGGILAVHHRVSDPEALAWSESCRALVFGLYPQYALGAMSDRCFAFGNPPST
jgi:Icc protein